jgi:hypothetical protein
MFGNGKRIFRPPWIFHQEVFPPLVRNLRQNELAPSRIRDPQRSANFLGFDDGLLSIVRGDHGAQPALSCVPWRLAQDPFSIIRKIQGPLGAGTSRLPAEVAIGYPDLSGGRSGN